MRRRSGIFVAGLLATAILAGTIVGQAVAQVVLKEVTTSTGFAGKGAFESESKTYLSGDKRRVESKFKFTGRFMKHFSPKGTSVEITRLDHELFWKFQKKKKDYEETTFQELRDMMAKGQESPLEAWQNAMRQSNQSGEEERKETVTWEKPKIISRPMGGSKTIAGRNCGRHLVLIQTVGTHTETGVKDTVWIKGDLWVTKSKMSEFQDVADFGVRLLEKLGFERQANFALKQLKDVYSSQFSDLAKELKKIDGFPLSTTIKVTKTDNISKAMRQSSGTEEPEEEETAVDITNVGGAIGGFFKKKAMKKLTKKNEKKGRKEVFSVTTTYTEVKRGPVKDNLFELPRKAKKKKKKS